MTVAEMIEALKHHFDPTDLLVVENDAGDYVPLADKLTRVRIGLTDSEHHNCVAVSAATAWPTEDGGIVYALPEED